MPLGDRSTQLEGLWADSCRNAGVGAPLAKLSLSDTIYSVHRHSDDWLVAIETDLDGEGAIRFRGDVVVGDPLRGRAVIFGDIEPETVLADVVADGDVAARVQLGDGAYVAPLPYVEGASVVIRRRRGATVVERRLDMA